MQGNRRQMTLTMSHVWIAHCGWLSSPKRASQMGKYSENPSFQDLSNVSYCQELYMCIWNFCPKLGACQWDRPRPNCPFPVACVGWNVSTERIWVKMFGFEGLECWHGRTETWEVAGWNAGIEGVEG